MATSSEPSVTELAQQAEALAQRREEGLAAIHLLVAASALEGSVKSLLEERGLGHAALLRCYEDHRAQLPAEDIQNIYQATRQVARSFRSRTPTAPHLFLALVKEPSSSARQVLEALGAEIDVLRGVARQAAQGLPVRQRRAASGAGSQTVAYLGSAPLGRGVPTRGVAVPVMPATPPAGGRVNNSGVHPVEISGRGARQPGQVVSIVPDLSKTPLPGRRHRSEASSLGDDSPAPSSDEASVSGSLDEQTIESSDPDELVIDVLQRGRQKQNSTASANDTAETVDDGLAALDALNAAARFELSRKKFPILTQVGRNLTAAAMRGRLDPVVGRDEEIECALDVLAKRHGNNPCLIGTAGVGKTSVARGIAQRMAETGLDERAPVVIEIPISELVAGTGTRGALAGRLNALKKEVQAAAGRVVLFFDEIHQLFSGEAAEEIAADLKLSLARGELPCIGATSVDEYRKVIESDAALSRRFSAVEIEEPTREDALLVMSSVAQKLERHHGLSYDADALSAAVSWSLRYLPGRALPDKAVSIIDLAGARSRRRGKAFVDVEAIAEVVSSQATMPIERLLESDADRMLGLEDMLRDRVVGHEEQLHKVARILRRNAAGLGARRPIGTFLLLGPTGVGKTETAKAIAEVLFHSETAMTRIDMAEMSEAHAVAKLVGAPPGYVGHDAGGQLTEAVRRRPYQVVLLDEVEKAHPEVLTAFLAVFDEGRMTDSRGRLVDFTNTVIILTSNLGARAAAESGRKRVGFQAGPDTEAEDRSQLVIDAARQALAPELYNRIDEVLAFSPLSRGDVLRIGAKLAKALGDELELSRGVRLDFRDSALEVLLDQGGFDPSLGARPLRRTMARQVEAPLAEALLSGELKAGDTWCISGESDQLRFEVVSAPASAETSKF